MKQNPNFLLREVADSLVLVPLGEATKAFPGMITMNPTAKFLWELLAEDQTKESLTAALVERYDVTEETAAKDVQTFLDKLTSATAIL
jgi:hypothetical protein